MDHRWTGGGGLQVLVKEREAANHMLEEIKAAEEARLRPLLEQNEKLRRLTKEQDEAIAALQKVRGGGMDGRREVILLFWCRSAGLKGHPNLLWMTLLQWTVLPGQR